MPNEEPTTGGLTTGNHLLLALPTAKIPQGGLSSNIILTK